MLCWWFTKEAIVQVELLLVVQYHQWLQSIKNDGTVANIRGLFL